MQQAENVLLGGVGLCQHRGGRLLEDLVFGQVCSFQSKVCILGAAVLSLRNGRDVGKVVDSLVQPFGNRNQFRTLNDYCHTGTVNFTSSKMSIHITYSIIGSREPKSMAVLPSMLTDFRFCVPVTALTWNDNVVLKRRA